jgi:hypothetical protein
MAWGDHIKVYRLLYYHHGIEIGDGTVVHFTGEPGRKSDAEIKRTPIEDFLCEGKLEIVEYSQALNPEQVIQTAFKYIGTKGYNLAFNNCEHFARYCKTGDYKSKQVEDATATAGGSGAVAAGVYMGMAGVATAGSVVGLSGAGIMSGLGAIGPGGVVGGVLTLAAAPAVCSNLAVNKILQDDEKLTDEEREARSAGRVAAKVGTAAGAVGTISTISASGVVVGLSASGITSGLAAIGGTVGGGMAAGVAVSIAAPAAAAFITGVGIYKLFKWLRD